MGWSLNYREIKEPELLNRFLLCAGKALYLATAFESKCRSVLGILRMVRHFENTGDAPASLELLRAMKDGPLARTIQELGLSTIVSQEQLILLERAKEARNAIAHDSTDIGELSHIPATHIFDRVESLRHEVDTLIEGDNLVSKWIYEIEEKEPAPPDIQKSYPKWVTEWVFGEFSRT